MIPSDQTYCRGEATYITPAYYQFLFANDLVVDASEGGLVQGPSADEGGITLLGWNKDAEVFIGGQAAGWDFLINAFANHDHQESLIPMANHSGLSVILFQPYEIPAHINVLNVVPRKVNGEMITPVLFFSTSQMGLMPKVPAKKNLSFLDTINREAWLKHVIEKQPKDTIRESALLARFGQRGSN